MKIKVHNLSDIDKNNRIGVCSNCGIVKLKKRKNWWRCNVAVLMEKKRYRNKYRKIISAKRLNRLFGISGDVPEIPQFCPLCGRNVPLSLDHNHVTNKVRGWICSKCNSILGFANDDTTLLKKMIDYLK